MFWKHYNLRKKYSFSLAHVGDTDQIPVYFESPLAMTVNRKGGKNNVCNRI